jgi:hypothetical protein
MESSVGHLPALPKQYHRLAAAILLKAVRDLDIQDPRVAADAAIFLSSSGLDLAEMLGIPPDRVGRWVAKVEVSDIIGGLLELLEEAESHLERQEEGNRPIPMECIERHSEQLNYSGYWRLGV